MKTERKSNDNNNKILPDWGNTVIPLYPENQADLNTMSIIEKLISEIKLETFAMVKDLARQILIEVLQPVTDKNKLTKKQQFDLDVKKKSEERMLALIKKHSKK